jgi:hypothetical protein
MSSLVLKKDVARGIVAPGRSFPAPETCHHVQHSIRLAGAGKVDLLPIGTLLLVLVRNLPRHVHTIVIILLKLLSLLIF